MADTVLIRNTIRLQLTIYGMITFPFRSNIADTTNSKSTIGLVRTTILYATELYTTNSHIDNGTCENEMNNG